MGVVVPESAVTVFPEEAAAVTADCSTPAGVCGTVPSVDLRLGAMATPLSTEPLSDAVDADTDRAVMPFERRWRGAASDDAADAVFPAVVDMVDEAGDVDRWRWEVSPLGTAVAAADEDCHGLALVADAGFFATNPLISTAGSNFLPLPNELPIDGMPAVPSFVLGDVTEEPGNVLLNADGLGGHAIISPTSSSLASLPPGPRDNPPNSTVGGSGVGGMRKTAGARIGIACD